MNLLITYATNSGGTFEVSNLISTKLTEAGHQVTVKSIQEIASPDDLSAYDAIFLGSPSWDFQGTEGMPHDDVMAFINNNQSANFNGKKFIIFGLGDETYEHFCGAVGHMEEYIKSHSGQLAAESLRLNQYYNDMEAGNANVQTWLNEKVLPTLS